MIDEFMAAVAELAPGLDPLQTWSNKDARVPLILFGVCMVGATLLGAKIAPKLSPKAVDREIVDKEESDVQD